MPIWRKALYCFISLLTLIFAAGIVVVLIEYAAMVLPDQFSREIQEVMDIAYYFILIPIDLVVTAMVLFLLLGIMYAGHWVASVFLLPTDDCPNFKKEENYVSNMFNFPHILATRILNVPTDNIYNEKKAINAK